MTKNLLTCAATFKQPIPKSREKFTRPKHAYRPHPVGGLARSGLTCVSLLCSDGPTAVRDR